MKGAPSHLEPDKEGEGDSPSAEAGGGDLGSRRHGAAGRHGRGFSTFRGRDDARGERAGIVRAARDWRDAGGDAAAALVGRGDRGADAAFNRGVRLGNGDRAGSRLLRGVRLRHGAGSGLRGVRLGDGDGDRARATVLRGGGNRAGATVLRGRNRARALVGRGGNNDGGGHGQVSVRGDVAAGRRGDDGDGLGGRRGVTADRRDDDRDGLRGVDGRRSLRDVVAARAFGGRGDGLDVGGSLGGHRGRHPGDVRGGRGATATIGAVVVGPIVLRRGGESEGKRLEREAELGIHCFCLLAFEAEALFVL